MAEFRAAGRLVQAAERMRDHPVALQLRYLQTMTEVSEEKNATFALIPFPMELLESFRTLRGKGPVGRTPSEGTEEEDQARPLHPVESPQPEDHGPLVLPERRASPSQAPVPRLRGGPPEGRPTSAP